MRLVECYIEAFGKLRDYRYTFSRGLNIINEENGFGKTTLSAFIKAIFYGLDDGRRQNLLENDRKRYTPWGGGSFGGWLTIEVSGKLYRIERRFGAKASLDSFALYDLASGNISNDYSENIGEELFLIDADGFERTIFLSEKRFAVKNDNKTISAKLSDLVGYEWDVGSLDEALDELEERRKYYYKKGGSGKIKEIKEKIAGLDNEIIRVRQIIDALPEKEARLSHLHSELTRLEELRRSLSEYELRGNIERQYQSLQSELLTLEEKAKALSDFFAPGVPTTEALSYNEGLLNEARIIEERTADAPSIDNPEILRGKIEKANKYIDILNKNGQKSKAKVPPVSIISLSCVLSGLGAILASTVSATVGIIFIALAIIPLILGVKLANEEKAKKENENEIIKEFLIENGKDEVEENGYLSALLELRARYEASLSLITARCEELDKNRERAKELRSKVDTFLSAFTFTTNEPFSEIRRRLLELEITESAIKNKRREIERFASENKLDTETSASENEFTDIASREEIEEKIKKLRSEITILERSYKDDLETAALIDELNERRCEVEDELKDANTRYDTILKVKEHLILAKDSLTAKYLGKTRELFSEYIGLMTEESPESFTLSVDFGIKKTEGATTHEDNSYSLGTREIYAIAARLALVGSLYGEDAPFVLLDDPFCHLDDTRCAEALRLISKIALTRQIIYLTCSKSRTI